MLPVLVNAPNVTFSAASDTALGVSVGVSAETPGVSTHHVEVILAAASVSAASSLAASTKANGDASARNKSTYP